MSFALSLKAPQGEMTKRQKQWLGVGAGLAFCALFVGFQVAMAGTGGGGGGGTSPFDDVWTMLVDWTQGTLGRIITLLVVLVGVTAGVLTQSLGAFAIGLGAGLGLFFAPDIIDTLFGATIAPMVDAITPVTHAVVTTAVPVAQAIAPVVGM